MKSGEQKRILISRPDRIGDVILSTPMPREIKKKYPDSFVAMLVRKYTADIFKNNPFVDELILIDDEKTFFQKIIELRKFNFNYGLMLLPNERINYLLFFAGIKNRIGVGHKFYQFITNVKSVYRHKYIPLRHEADYCMDLARKIGVETSNLKTEIYLSSDEVISSNKKKKNYLEGKKYLIGVHSTSGNSAPNWTRSRYRDLVDELIKNDEYKIAVTDNEIPPELKNIPGVIYPNINSDLRSSIINFSALDVLISASTGPMHLAAALNVKTVSLFCPLTACSPVLWGPSGNPKRVVLPDSDYCQNKCPGDPKICTLEGAGGIGVEKIISNLRDILQAG